MIGCSIQSFREKKKKEEAQRGETRRKKKLNFKENLKRVSK